MAKKAGGGLPFRHGPAQPPQASRGTIGSSVNRVSPALGIKNVAGGGGTNGQGSHGAKLGSMPTPKGPKPK